MYPTVKVERHLLTSRTVISQVKIVLLAFFTQSEYNFTESEEAVLRGNEDACYRSHDWFAW